MIIRKKAAFHLLRKGVQELCGGFAQNSKFLSDLLKQDDWSFVIKAHAMLEALVTEMLLVHLGEPRLKKVIERLPLSDSQTGKVVIAKQMELLPDEHRKFIRFFSELRNSLVHNSENLNFAFERHLQTLDKNQKSAWKEAIVFSTESNSQTAWEEMVEQETKKAIFISLLIVLGNCTINSEHKKILRKLDEVSERSTTALLKKVGLLPQKRNRKRSPQKTLKTVRTIKTSI